MQNSSLSHYRIPSTKQPGMVSGLLKKNLETTTKGLSGVNYVFISRESHQDGRPLPWARQVYQKKKDIRSNRFFDFHGCHPNFEAAGIKWQNYCRKDGEFCETETERVKKVSETPQNLSTGSNISNGSTNTGNSTLSQKPCGRLSMLQYQAQLPNREKGLNVDNFKNLRGTLTTELLSSLWGQQDVEKPLGLRDVLQNLAYWLDTQTNLENSKKEPTNQSSLMTWTSNTIQDNSKSISSIPMTQSQYIEDMGLPSSQQDFQESSRVMMDTSPSSKMQLSKKNTNSTYCGKHNMSIKRKDGKNINKCGE